jgi:hypothetical protein
MKALLATTFSLVTGISLAAPPCDFKGLSVGDTKTPQKIMEALGVTNYKVNPTEKDIWKNLEDIAKYGSGYVAEKADYELGPACFTTSNSNHCRIPYGYSKETVGIGNNNDAVSVLVSFRNGKITEIDVGFDATMWDEYVPLFSQKYGSNWIVERDPFMVVTNRATNNELKVERIIMTNKSQGLNVVTKDRCQISATNYDIIFTHYMPVYQGMLTIELVSKNL